MDKAMPALLPLIDSVEIDKKSDLMFEQAEATKGKEREKLFNKAIIFGYQRSTTRQIAKSLDISEGTLYRYIGSKKDILHLICLVPLLHINETPSQKTQNRASITHYKQID